MRKPSEHTGAGSSRSKQKILAYLWECTPERIGEAQCLELRSRFAPISERRLRTILRESGIPLDPLVEGVRQESLGQLERTLLALLQEYPRMPRECRRAVITAKDHARLAMRKANEDKRTLKEEMILWMLTWLENPGVFPVWVALRKRSTELWGQ